MRICGNINVYLLAYRSVSTMYYITITHITFSIARCFTCRKSLITWTLSFMSMRCLLQRLFIKTTVPKMFTFKLFIAYVLFFCCFIYEFYKNCLCLCFTVNSIFSCRCFFVMSDAMFLFLVSCWFHLLIFDINF